MLEINIENLWEGRVRVALIGRLDTLTYTYCEDRLEPLLTAATRALIFDMAGLNYVSSMGLRVLITTTTTLAAHGGKCLLTRLPPPIRKLIEITNTLPNEVIFATVEEANRHLDLMQQRAGEKAANPAKPAP